MGSRPHTDPLISGRRWSRAPHHRRRRALAFLGAAACLVLLGVAVGRGGHTLPAGAERPHTTGYFRAVQTLAGSGTGSLSARELAAQNAAINRTLAYTPYVRVAGAQHREVALTFDDGPGPYTPEILSVLGREDVPATFFEVGLVERYFHASTTQVVADDYPIGDHTFAHAQMSHLPRKQQRGQLLREARMIQHYGAPFPRLFRPPYGLWDSTTLALLHRYRMLMVLWTIDTGDYRRPGVQAIVDAAVSGVKPGAIILLHDAGGERSQTVAALPKIITELRGRGYRFATVPQLLVDNPPPRNQQIYSVRGSGG